MEVKPSTKKFRIAFRGYDIDEVNEYVDGKISKYEEVLSEQKSRIFELVEANGGLMNELKEMAARERGLSLSLIQANEKADQIIANARKIADDEMERVRVFQEKWEFFAKKLLETLSPKELIFYNRMSERIDSTYKQFASQTVQVTDRQAPIRAVKQAQEQGSRHAIGLDEVYKTEESLTDLLDGLL